MDNWLNIDFFGLSDLGMTRSENQDSFGCFPREKNVTGRKGRLFVVADGMGGHTRGAEASKLAVEYVSRIFSDYPSESIRESLVEGFRAANDRIFELSKGLDERTTMGTTCTALVAHTEGIMIAHVGDSKVFRITQKKIDQLTSDHTRVGELRRHGVLSDEEAKRSNQRSILSRALGVEQNIEVDTIEEDIPRDETWYLMCTDGLSSLAPNELKNIVSSNFPRTACEELIRLEKKRGGNDNITVTVIHAHNRIPKSVQKTTFSIRKVFRKKPLLLGLAILSIVLSFILVMSIFGTNMFWKNFQDNSQSQKSVPSKNAIGAQKTAKVDFYKATSFLDQGELDSATVYFNKVLAWRPTHMGAIEGINAIVNAHIAQAEQMQSRGQHEQAQLSYGKALVLRPKDSELKKLFSLNKRLANESRMITENKAPKKGNVTDTVAVQIPPELSADPSEGWLFKGLKRGVDFSLGKNSIFLEATPTVKKVINQAPIRDYELKISIRKSNRFEKGRYGVIVGFSEEGGEEEYLLAAFHSEGGFFLNQVNQEGSVLLIKARHDSIPPGAVHQFRVKCFGQWVIAYLNGNLIQAWQGDNIITGRFGLYAEPGMLIEFRDISFGPIVLDRTRKF